MTNVTMKRYLLACFLFVFAFQLHAADYYWIGGGGNWSDLNAHWRLGSPTGGVPSIVPSAADNVFFGSYSGFTAANQTVTLNANAFCNNMTWESGVPNNPILTRGGSSTLYVSGNLVLQPTVAYNDVVNIEFVGANPATLTTNGPINAILNLTVNKPGSGLTLLDDLIYTGSTTNNSYGLTLTAGYLDASDKTVAVYSFWSENNNPRHLDITGGNFSVVRNFYFRGANKTTAAVGSYIRTGIRLVTDGGEFDEVEATSDSPNNDLFSVYNTTFRKLVFSNPLLSSNARIHAGNTVDSLIFLGSGSVRESSNTVRYVSFAGNGTIGGANNVIQYAEVGGWLNLIDNGGHVFDTLLTAPNKNIWITGEITINEYFVAGGEPCDGFTEITGSSGGTLHFADGAVAEIDNVLLTNLAATGSLIPLTVNGIDNEGNSGFIFNIPDATNRTLYWVGGAGDWNDGTHWSESSGGPGGACIPFIGDDVVFDGNSGLNAGGTVATSGNTYCRDMTWAATITGSPTFTTNNNFYMQVYGSVVLNPNVTMNARLDMRGTEAVTFTTNGNVKGNNRIMIRKEADDALAGGVTLLDDWLNPTGSFQLNRGHLNVAGRTVDIDIFTSNLNNNGRHVDMRNADVAVNRWEYRSNAKTLDADHSHLSIRASIYTTGNLVQYDAVDISTGSLNTDNFWIDGTGFRELIFSNPSLTTVAQIGANNVVERLEFKGQGRIAGTGNVIDSLITGENRNFWFGQGTNTINEYLKAIHPDCSGLGEIRSSGTSSTIVFGANADVDISNVYMENIVATGGGGTLTLPIPFSGADAGGNSGWSITASDGDARYWVGGAGDWNDASHWSTVSGGPGGACIPTVANDVYFDENSGFGTTAAARTITVNNGNAYFRNMDWTGAANNPILNRNTAWNMEAWGESIVLNPAVTLNASIQLRGPEAATVTGQTLGNFDMELRKPGSSLTIANDYNNNQTDIYLYDGDLIAPDKVLTLNAINNDNRDNDIFVDISGSTLNLSSVWRYSGTTANRTLDATDAVINTVDFIARGFTYHQVNISGTAEDDARFSEITAGKITFTQTNVISAIGIDGTDNQIDTVEYKGGGRIYGTNNTIGTLIFFPGSRYVLTAGTNTIITNSWFGSGTPCQLTEIWSSSTAPATVTKADGAVDFDYVRLQRITATGGAEFEAGAHSLDLGGSSGWDIAPYDGASPIEGLGPDVSLSDAEFPYTISTAGFFGSPLSRYEWKKDGVVVGTADELVVTEPGEYAIKVDFPDGCLVLDTILIVRDSADIVTVKTLKDIAQTSYVPGEEVVYTITVSNNGPDDAIGVSIVDNAPSETAISSWTATVTAGTVDLPNVSGSGDLAETIPLLPNGAEVVYEVTLSTASGRLADLSNAVEVTSSTPDPEPECEACATVPVPAAPVASVSIAKGLSDDTQEGYNPGNDVTYTLTITNDGPSDARDVAIADTAPEGTTIGSWTAVVTTGDVTLPNVSGTGDLAETIAMLPSGAVVTYEVTVTTPADFIDDLINTATVTSTTDDPDVTDNTAVTAGLPSVPAAPVSGGDLEECAEDPLQTLTAVATVPEGATVVWYDSPSGGNVVTDPVLDAVGTVTYYAEARKGTLTSLTRTAVTLTIHALPGVVITDPAVACAGSTIDLTAAAVTDGSDAGLTYTYYTDAAGSDVLADPAAVAASGTYYIRGTDPETGCSAIMPVTVQFVDRPVVAVTHPDCVTGSGTIVVTAPLGTGFEYSINGEDYQSAPLFEGVAPGTYEVTARHVSVAGCVSDAEEVTLNEEPTTVTPTVVQPQCGETTGSIEFPADTDYEYAVYRDGESPVYQPSPLFADLAPGEYLVRMRSADCEALPVTVTIAEAPVVPDAPVSDGDQEACGASPLQTLTATATVPAGVSVVWYDSPSGGNVVTAPILDAVGTVTYYAEATNGTCVSESRTSVTLTIHPVPVVDEQDDAVVCGAFTLPDITGMNLTGDRAYYIEPGGTGTRYEIGETISAAGTYTLYAYATTTEGCSVESSFALTINETPEAGTLSDDQSICYGETPAELNSVAAGTGTGTVTYRWEMSDNGSTWSVIPDAVEANFQPGALTTTTYYRRVTVATANGLTCESAPTDVVTVTVTGELAASAGPDQTKYHEGSFELDAALPALGTGIWSVVSTEQPAEFTDLTNPKAAIILLPNTSVTLRWTVSEADCSVFDEVTLTYVHGADVAVSKTLKPETQESYVPGADVTYTITVTNNGPGYAEEVRIRDIVPAGTTVASWTAQVLAGTVFLPGTTGSGELDETILLLPVGAAVAYEVTVTTPADFIDDLINTATVTSTTDDPDVTDNTAVTAGLPSVPAAPVSGGDLEECAEDPLQTLTAVATVPEGATVVWYDSPSGGNVVTDPVLDAVGTVTYYAEARKGTLTSLTRTAVTLTIHALPGVVITDPAVACAGSTIDLTAAAVTDGSDAGLTYTYYTDAAGSDVLADPAAVAASGTYYIRGTDPETGCSAIMPVTVQFVDRPVVAVTHPDCVTGSGTIVVTAPLGTGFEYSINGEDYQSAPLFEGVAPGTYEVTARHVSVAGCVSDAEEVTLNEEPTTVTPTVVQPQCGETTGSIEFPADTDYEYAVYRDGESPVYQPSPLFADLAPGEYLVRMRSADCEALPVTVTIAEAPVVPDAPVSDGDQEACGASPLQTLTATATVPAGVSVVWYDSPSGGNVVTAPILDAVGTVTYYAEATNGTCVSESRTSVTLTIHALPQLVITDPAVTCAGETVDLTAVAITAGSDVDLNYSYYTDASGTTVLANPDAVAVTGTYYIKGTDPLTGCSTIAPVNVQFVDRPTVAVVHPDCAVDATGSIRITAPLGADFEYAVYEAGGTPVYSIDTEYAGLMPGTTYRVVARNTTADCESEVLEVVINATPTTYTPAVVHPQCGETTGSIEFPANADYEYAVYRDGEPPVYRSSPLFAELEPGEYIVQMRSTVVDCEALPVTVTIYAAPAVHAAPVGEDQTVCVDGAALPLRATATVPDGLSVVWYDAPVGGEVVTDPMLDAVGSVTYYAEATDGTCVSPMRTPVTLTIYAKPTIDPLDNAVACSSYVLPDITGTNLTGDKAYFTGPGGTGQRYEVGDAIAMGGTYPLYRYAATENGCYAEAGFTVTVLETPVADAGEDQTQANNPIFTLSANAPAVGTGTWSVVSGTPLVAISDINNPNASVSLAPGTSLTLRWTVNNGACEVADEVVLTHLAVPKADLHVTKTVDNAAPLVESTVVFTIEVGNDGPDDASSVTVVDELPSGYTLVSAEVSAGTYDESSGTWAVGGLASGASATLAVTATVNAEGEYLNTVRVQGNEEDPDADNNGAEASVAPVHPPRAEDDAPAGLSNKALTIAVLDNDVELTHAIDAMSVEIVSQPQHGTVSIGANGTIVYTSDRGYVGTDQLTYRVRDTEGHWSNVATVTVAVAANPLRVPNIFTPNGDGQNDRFEIEGIEGFDRAELVVFNRWGNEIYRRNDYDNSWGGEGIHEGTYYYMLTLYKGNVRQVEKGWVVLKKQ